RTIEVTPPASEPAPDAKAPSVGNDSGKGKGRPSTVIVREPSTRLLAAQIGFSETLVIGFPLPVDAEGSAACLPERGDGSSRFCIIPVDWSDSLLPHIQGATVLYGGNKALVRIDNGVASRLYAAFPSPAFTTIAAHMKDLLGPATDVVERQVRTVEGRNIDNPVMRWRKPGKDGAKATVLEIVRHDNVRRVFPDVHNGFIRAYDEDSAPIFSDVSPLDFMLIR
ncbi:MAG: hypothetical protein OQJ99_07325, partial [Rhodospirillales bacterium]|nr:hypothetical protein [Rhodospirillales bacterium]MCW9003584.1 hypothetical protein [Rhodospirillales bacterium]